MKLGDGYMRVIILFYELVLGIFHYQNLKNKTQESPPPFLSTLVHSLGLIWIMEQVSPNWSSCYQSLSTRILLNFPAILLNNLVVLPAMSKPQVAKSKLYHGTHISSKLAIVCSSSHCPCFGYPD